MKKTLFTNAVIHGGETLNELHTSMLVENGIIRAFDVESEQAKTVDLKGQHVYPCLIDAHVHMLLTIAVMAMGFNLCEIRQDGVFPDTMAGIEKRLREYASRQKKNAVIACNNYILTGIREQRMPTKEELDEWCGGRAAVVYNIDGHSTSLSSRMLELIGLPSAEHSGVLQGEENERVQGRIIDKVGSMITLPLLARGIAEFQNTCAAYGISVVGALEGNGDSPEDATTKWIAALARHFDVGVRLYPQYTDLRRVKPYEKQMRHKRIGGCGDWEMDGAVGAHSAAMNLPYKDTGEKADCYYTQEQVDAFVREAAENGCQIASHAIGEAAIERLLTSLEKTASGRFHRIEHCEFIGEESLGKLYSGKYAAVMQPGYAWIDKRYLHTYERYLPAEILERMKLKSLVDAGVCVCGSSDSPVQDIDPYLQMLGMTQFYNEKESLTPYEAFLCYTVNAARSLEEEEERGSLVPGKAADFFTADRNFFELKAEEVLSFRPTDTWYQGWHYKKKKGSIPEFLAMLLKPGKKT